MDSRTIDARGDGRRLFRPPTRTSRGFLLAWTIGCLVFGTLTAPAALRLDAQREAINQHDNAAATDDTKNPAGSSPTTKQFQAAMIAGRAFVPVAPSPKESFDHSDNAVANVITPTNTAGTIMMPFARVGATFIQRETLLFIGSEITAPDVDDSGTEKLDDQDPLDYWFAEPYTADGVHPEDYYWSRHATKVFAVKSGNISVTWRKRDTSTSQPDGTEGVDWYQDAASGEYFNLLTQTYLVSSSAVKDSQTIYWNSAPYAGPSVDLPGSRVGEVYFAYHSEFPEEVAYDADDNRDGTIDPETEGDKDGVLEDEVDSRLDRNNNTFTRTVWLETLGQNSQIRAQNLEGRIFMEILGDVASVVDGTEVREHLGFEVLTVVKYPNPLDLTVSLGEVIEPGTGADSLYPVAVDALSSSEFYFQHSIEGVELPTLYATRETENANDLMIHWMIEGVEGIRWPSEFNRYALVWPDDTASYSHYVRPAATTDESAKATAVALDSSDVPFIEYQDVIDEPRAKLTEDSRFYTRLDATVPAHRTLLRFNADDNVYFERVFSWLDDSLLALEPAYTNVSIATTPREVLVNGETDGTDDMNPFVLNTAYQTLVADGIAYVSSAAGTLQVINVTDPDSPWVIRSMDDGTIPTLDGQLTMTLNDGILFVASYHAGAITVFDTAKLVDTDTFAVEATVVGILKDDSTTAATSVTTQLVEATKLAQIGKTLVYQGQEKTYLYAAGNEDRLVIFDVSDVDAITLVDEAALEFDGVTFDNIRAAAIENDLAFVATTSSHAVLFVSLADPEIPVVLSVIQDEVGDFTRLASPGSLSVGDNVLYVASGDEAAVTLVDFTDATSPKWLAELRDGEGGFEFLAIRGTALDDGILFISSTSNNKLNIADVSDPSNPYLLQVISHGDADFPTLRGPRGVTVDGDTVYVSLSSSHAVTIFDYSPVTALSGAYATADLGDSVAADLATYSAALGTISWPDELAAPRVVEETVEVGKRIGAPSDELGSVAGDDYLAGYINKDVGTSFNVNAYVDPLDTDNDLAAANLGAVIPVNARPGANELEVWWMRSNNADTTNGFHTVYWPSAIGRYTIEWPSDPPEIVLASNDGSGALDSLPAKGSIYYQNVAGSDGYNPNEEHALMSGGQAYALRDDLNITESQNTSEGDYTSEPYVLLEYTESDGRPAMIAFKVLREKPEDGIRFKFDLEAGLVLQAPMPLPLLGAPYPLDSDTLDPKEDTLNSEVGSFSITSASLTDTTTGTAQVITDDEHLVVPFNTYALQNQDDLAASWWFYVAGADYDNKTVTGFVSAEVPVTLTEWAGTATTDAATLRMGIASAGTWAAGQSVWLASEADGTTLATTLASAATDEDGDWFIDVNVAEASQDSFTTNVVLIAMKTDLTSLDLATDNWTLGRGLAPASMTDTTLRELYTRFTREDRKGNTWIYRGPHGDDDSPAMDMQFYYPTQDGFWFPSLAADDLDQPEVGSLTPYLRPLRSDGTYQGDGIYGTNKVETVDGVTTETVASLDEHDPLNNALPIAYRPVWPDDVPTLNMAQTLTTTINGLPAIRGNSSLEVLYEQSQVGNQGSVKLHDSTRDKEYEFAVTNIVDGVTNYLVEIPASVATSTYQGDTYFPNLPPHLESRFFFDPNRGTDGALVLRGEFRDETVGEDYVLLNVLSSYDLDTLKDLVPDEEEDEVEARWDYAIDHLTAVVELFVEDPAVPGTFVTASSVAEKIATLEQYEDGDLESPDADYYQIDADDADEDGDDSDYILTAFGTKASVLLESVSSDHQDGIAVTASSLVEITDDDEAVDSYTLTAMGPGSGYVTLIAGDGKAFTETDDPVSILIFKVDPTLHQGEVKAILSDNPLAEKVTLQQVVDLAARTDLYEYEWMTGAPVDGLAPDFDSTSDNPGSGWIDMDSTKFLEGIRAIVGDTADVQSLSDQHIIMRYRPLDDTHASYVDADGDGEIDWSEWTEPTLVEGWIKRVLAGINPFNQRTTDLFNNAVDTDASMLTLAGTKWEGDVALNSETIEDFGLIEIYETVLNRGRGLSIDAGINYGPANDALLLAAGYINDLYMFVGNEALADALNPTIGIGTADGALGDVATALFAFKGQTATLLEEELALLRGRDDFLPPGVEANPVYNRLFWNYTRGIDSGEVIYAQNYNIQEDNDGDFDGVINAEDAAVLYPQGHGDAYGHYLTALKGYYSLIMDADFDWVPRTEGVTILGATVQVDYTDERKFASAASAIAKTGKQVFDLTWRQDYQSGGTVGWEHFGAEAIRENDSRGTTRYWGADHWASRTGQGGYLNWVAGNAMLPEIDDDPDHEGIQVIDRTTVPELAELADLGRDLQTGADSLDAHLNPLGLADDSVAFDIRPLNDVGTGIANETHFEQIFDRAKMALRNAVIAFDDAKGITGLMRSETDSLADFQTSVDSQELAFTNALIEIYGTPYADDIGVGQTYSQDYEGPDLLHYMYVDDNEITGPVVDPAGSLTIDIDIQDYTEDFHETSARNKIAVDFIEKRIPYVENESLAEGTTHITYTLDSHGFFDKPSDWTGKRESPGKLQSAISDIVKARNKANLALRNQEALKYELDRMIQVFDAYGELKQEIRDENRDTLDEERRLARAKYVFEILEMVNEHANINLDKLSKAANRFIPDSIGAGFTTIFDPGSGPEGAQLITTAGASAARNAYLLVKSAAFGSYELGLEEIIADRNFNNIAPKERRLEKIDAIFDIDMKIGDVQMAMHEINESIQRLADARSKYQRLLAEGNRIQAEREVFRRRTAALTQGYRTRDAAFRIFRDEKLERYNTLFDLAARYAFLAAKAFDYETGLMHTDQGLDFIDRIVSSRALGVVTGGEPQFAGSDTGDPGLSSTLAEMASEWQVLKGRLGLNNPDVYGTTVSLRTENFRLRPASSAHPDSDTGWREVLEEGRMANLLEDDDVLRHCLQIDEGNGLPVPGIVLEFGTEISSGYNLFGQLLAGGDHAFDVSAYATKIFSVGVVLEGYNGMDNPLANASTTDGASANDPTFSFFDSAALSATPHIYFIPVGLDAMRSPPLGDESTIRTWSVQDVTIPLPFNIGGSDFSTKKLFQSADSLTEDLFSIRKHQAFRPVSDPSVFGANAQLLPSIYTNNRLIGRSVWNTGWKLVIPGRTLLNDPDQGLDILIDTLTDIKLHFETYSHSGN